MNCFAIVGSDFFMHTTSFIYVLSIHVLFTNRLVSSPPFSTCSNLNLFTKMHYSKQSFTKPSKSMETYSVISVLQINSSDLNSFI